MPGPPTVESSPQEPSRAGAGTALAQVAFTVAAAAVVVPLLTFVELLRVPAGGEVRPMSQALAMIVGSVVGLIVVPPMAIIAGAVARARREPPTRWPIVAAVAGLVAFALPPAVFVAILGARRLTLAP